MNITEQIVLNIREKCINGGSNALINLTKDIDKIELSSIEFEVNYQDNIHRILKESIEIAISNVTKFHNAEYQKLLEFESNKIETSVGIECWKKFTPIETVGVYIPNKLFSSAIMNIIPAQIAGCKEIAVCTPPEPSAELLHALYTLGIKKVFTIGGAQAIFAMAYGLGGVPKVSKIFGPGNEFVDCAKRMVANEVAIDMPAGPSEVLVIADQYTNMNSIIHDLLAQLEHGKESKAWLFCDYAINISECKKRIEDAAKSSSRWHILEHSIQNLVIKTFDNILSAIEASNKISPEHLILNIENARHYIGRISNAGSVFIGRNTPESLGDYLSGTNHVLPTNGFAKAYSGLSVLSFGKFITFQEASEEGLHNVANNIKCMANFEGLEFHSKSVNRL